MNEKELKNGKWEESRDLAAEIEQSIREMRAGKAARVHHFKVSKVTEVRAKVGLSQRKFATVLGVSTRTLQEWEQGRRKPSGAAQSLLKIAAKRPDVLRELFGD